MGLTAFCYTCHYLRSWAYARGMSPASLEARFFLTTNGPADVWLGFTHAYFPTTEFDEHAVWEDADRHRWAFAQKGDGYLALTAAQGLELITYGDNAYRELRSHGRHNVWLCQMGGTAKDGSFGGFQERVLALNPDFGELSVQSATLRGETVTFGWEGPLLVDGKEQPITGFKHYENPYCVADWPAEQMDIGLGEQVLRLKFRS